MALLPRLYMCTWQSICLRMVRERIGKDAVGVYLRYHPRTYVERLRKTTKQFRTARIPVYLESRCLRLVRGRIGKEVVVVYLRYPGVPRIEGSTPSNTCRALPLLPSAVWGLSRPQQWTFRSTKVGQIMTAWATISSLRTLHGVCLEAILIARWYNASLKPIYEILTEVGMLQSAGSQ
jgi:hypothetical protein